MLNSKTVYERSVVIRMVRLIKIILFRLFSRHYRARFHSKDINGRKRPLTHIGVSGIDCNDAPKFCDAYIESATWEDTNEPLTDEELDYINKNSVLVNNMTYDYLY